MGRKTQHKKKEETKPEEKKEEVKKEETKKEEVKQTTQPTTQQTTQQTIQQTTQNQQQNQQQIPSIFDSSINQGNDLWGQQGSNVDYNQIVNSQEYQQLMSQMLQDPQFLETLIQSNPQLAQLYQTNPDVIRQLLSTPEFIQNVMQLQGQMNQGDFGGQEEDGLTEDEAKQIYAVQLQQLKDMGFSDESKNIQALLQANGNIDAAIDFLMSNM